MDLQLLPHNARHSVWTYTCFPKTAGIQYGPTAALPQRQAFSMDLQLLSHNASIQYGPTAASPQRQAFSIDLHLLPTTPGIQYGPTAASPQRQAFSNDLQLLPHNASHSSM
jgi:regulation of enolase protein 1 (concanavalin A-like superfamily)